MPLVEVTFIEGRDKQKTTELIKRLTDVVQEVFGAPRDSIRVILREVPPEHWGVGGVPKG